VDERTWFGTAARGFREVVGGLREKRWDDPGLGEWDVRSLLGHTTRAFLTLETYLGAAADAHPGGSAPPGPGSAADYFRAARQGLADPAQVVARGREAGRALGDRPARAALEIAARVTELVDRTPDDAPVATPVGPMRLVDYLPTRAFELTVHGIDLARATGVGVPTDLEVCAGAAVTLAVELADPAGAVEVLSAVTGREPLPEGFSVL